MSRNLQSQATERDRYLKQINSKKWEEKKDSVKLHVYSRKKKEDEMVTARQFEVNECKFRHYSSRRKGSWNSQRQKLKL